MPPANEASENTISPSMKNFRLSEEIGQPAPQEQKAAERERIGVHHPRKIGGGRSKGGRPVEGSATFTIEASMTTTSWVSGQQQQGQILGPGRVERNLCGELMGVIWKLTSGSGCNRHYRELRFRLSTP